MKIKELKASERNGGPQQWHRQVVMTLINGDVAIEVPLHVSMRTNKVRSLDDNKNIVETQVRMATVCKVGFGGNAGSQLFACSVAGSETPFRATMRATGLWDDPLGEPSSSDKFQPIPAPQWLTDYAASLA